MKTVAPSASHHESASVLAIDDYDFLLTSSFAYPNGIIFVRMEVIHRFFCHLNPSLNFLSLESFNIIAVLEIVVCTKFRFKDLKVCFRFSLLRVFDIVENDFINPIEMVRRLSCKSGRVKGHIDKKTIDFVYNYSLTLSIFKY